MGDDVETSNAQVWWPWERSPLPRVRVRVPPPIGVRTSDGQLNEAAVAGGLAQNGHIYGKLADAGLDDELPERRGAHENIVAVRHDTGTQMLCPLVSSERLKEDVCVERQPHRSPSKHAMTLSGKGASRSPGS